MEHRRTAADSPIEFEFLSLAQVAARMGCSRRHVRRLCERREMPQPLRLGALLRWSRASLDRWVAAGCPRSDEKVDR
jgi:excisionase family DNA binding protein